MKDQATEAAIAGAAQKISIGGGTAAFFGGLTANEIAAFGGLLIAMVGGCVHWYYTRKADRRGVEADRRAKELHDARLKALQEDAAEYGDGGL